MCRRCTDNVLSRESLLRSAHSLLGRANYRRASDCSSRPPPFTRRCLTPSLLWSVSLRTLEEAALVAKDTVVCAFQKENTEWCLCVWRGWGSRELEVFYQSCEELGRMETSMRKRR